MNMPEKFLHLVWSHSLFSPNLFTMEGEPLRVLYKGKYNYGQGPDFYEAAIELNGIKWYGSIEIEVKAQNWYAHQHHQNADYANVILLVCYECDEQPVIKNCHDKEIPILILKPYLERDLVPKLEKLVLQEFPCRSFLGQYPYALQKVLLTQKAVERLEEKVLNFKHLDMETMSWRLLWKAFGDPYHSEFFLKIAEVLSPAYFFECNEQVEKEAMVLGAAGFLERQVKDDYFQTLRGVWDYLRVKYGLHSLEPCYLNFKTRYHSYPQVLMMQLVAWLERHGNKLLRPEKEFFEDFGKVSDFWKEHIDFGKPSKTNLGIGKQKITKLLVNWYFPFWWHYYQTYSSIEVENLLEDFVMVEKEDNKITRKLADLGWKIENGLESQGGVQLYKRYCTERRCLDCGVGQWYLKKGDYSLERDKII